MRLHAVLLIETAFSSSASRGVSSLFWLYSACPKDGSRAAPIQILNASLQNGVSRTPRRAMCLTPWLRRANQNCRIRLKRVMPAVSLRIPCSGQRILKRYRAAQLIERCGWKGRALGRAAVHARHALVIINNGNACGADILKLAEVIQRDVYRRFGVRLEPEPTII